MPTLERTQPGIWGALRSWRAAHALREPVILLEAVASASEGDAACDELRERSRQMLGLIDWMESLCEDLVRRTHLEELNAPPPRLDPPSDADPEGCPGGDRLELAERQLETIERTLQELLAAARAAMHGRVSQARRRTYELLGQAVAAAQGLHERQFALVAHLERA